MTETTGQRNPLTLTATQLRRATAVEADESHRLQGTSNTATVGIGIDPGHAQRVTDVFGHRHVRPQGIGLKDDPDLAFLRRRMV